MQMYLRAADAVVLPYKDVLTSGSAILAMTFGQPVIAPAIGCLPESLGAEGTILYDPSTPDGLERALRGRDDDGPRDARGACGCACRQPVVGSHRDAHRGAVRAGGACLTAGRWRARHPCAGPRSHLDA